MIYDVCLSFKQLTANKDKLEKLETIMDWLNDGFQVVNSMILVVKGLL